MFGMGHWEILIILLVVLLIFGAKRIPEMAQGMGKGIREFRKAMRDVQEEVDLSDPEPSQNVAAPPPGDRVARDTASGGAAAATPEQRDQTEGTRQN